MKRILFLDDNPARQAWAARALGENGNLLSAPRTAAEAIAILHRHATRKPFTTAYLDHDLGDHEYADPSRKDSGSEVVRWIVANKPTIHEIVVHTMNTPAGNLMVRTLREAGYHARYRWFPGLAQDHADD